MKKVVIAITMLATLNMTVMTGCKKAAEVRTTSNTNTSVSSNSKNYEADLKQINQKHFQLHNNAMAKQSAPSGVKKFVVGTADAAGVVGTASALWPAIATGFGAFAVGFAAGLIGAGASIGAWYGMDLVITETGDETETTGAEMKQNIANHTGAYAAVTNPHGNPYESVGVRHNELMKVWAQRAYDVSISCSTMKFEVAELTTNEVNVTSSTCPNTFGISLHDYFYTEGSITDPSTGDMTITPFVNYALAGAENGNLQTIFATFFDGAKQLFQTSDINGVMTYINDYEEYFIEDESLSAREKQCVLTGLAVAKHSYALWDDAITN